MPFTLIFNHCLGDSGLGDTIRAMYAYFILSRKVGFSIYYDFTGCNLGHCFAKNTNHICTKDCKRFKDFSGTGAIKTLEFVNFIQSIAKYPENHVFHIRTNHCFDVIEFKEFHLRENREAFLNWLKLTSRLTSRINNLSSKSYIAVHIRCGDAHMKNGPCTGDSRINPLDKKIDKMVETLSKQDKVVVFTDNQDLRQRLRKYCLNTRTAIHIGKKANPDEVIDTVAEFFILGKANRVIAPVRSGFSYWPAVLFGKQINTS